MEPNQIYKQALETWGAESQSIMLFEEMAELQKEICKHFRGKDNVSAIAEEIADVRIMLDQMELQHNCSALVDEARRYKLNRLAKRLYTRSADGGKA